MRFHPLPLSPRAPQGPEPAVWATLTREERREMARGHLASAGQDPELAEFLRRALTATQFSNLQALIDLRRAFAEGDRARAAAAVSRLGLIDAAAQISVARARKSLEGAGTINQRSTR